VVRNREKISELKSQLTHLGADVVLTEEEARQAWRELPRPRLALNCVGGASGTELCKALAEGGVHVTYGGMSLKPVIAATSHLIFKVLTFTYSGNILSISQVFVIQIFLHIKSVFRIPALDIFYFFLDEAVDICKKLMSLVFEYLYSNF